MSTNVDNYCVYMHINKINNKKYIGITKQNPEYRWGKDGINYKSSPYFYNAIEKYGWDNFEHKILYTNLNKDEACEKEKELIRQYDTQNKEFGYNILEGGSAPSIPEEVRLQMSESMLGNTNGLGKKCSEEKKRKISEAQKGRRLTEEHKKKLSDAKKGSTHVTISEEAKKKISNAHKKNQVFCLENQLVYPSIQECARKLELQATSICACCKGRIKSVHGYHFEYYYD